MPIALSNYLAFSLTIYMYMCSSSNQTDIHAVVVHLQVVFCPGDGVFAFELGIGAIAAAALTRLMNRDRSLPGRQEAIAQNLITKGNTLHNIFNLSNQSNMI